LGRAEYKQKTVTRIPGGRNADIPPLARKSKRCRPKLRMEDFSGNANTMSIYVLNIFHPRLYAKIFHRNGNLTVHNGSLICVKKKRTTEGEERKRIGLDDEDEFVVVEHRQAKVEGIEGNDVVKVRPALLKGIVTEMTVFLRVSKRKRPPLSESPCR